MERIEALINKLKEQSDQNAAPDRLLSTVQLLQYELEQLKNIGAKTLGTSKVAVVLPASMHVSPGYEKYAPQPVEATEIREVKETVLIDQGSLSLVQKNGQLDMVFDPMTEIPTLAHQPKDREVNDMAGQSESLNDKLKQGKTELVEDLRRAIGINDRFLFINELFRGDEAMYERSIKTLNAFNMYAEAEYWISRELKIKLGWSNNLTVQHFDQLVKRRFS